MVKRPQRGLTFPCVFYAGRSSKKEYFVRLKRVELYQILELKYKKKLISFSDKN
jgi:hypothetical protein